MTDSIYDQHDAIDATVSQGQHREIIGGLWDEVGRLQFDFLRSHGLSPTDHLLDIGCGSLRGGLHFAAYLDPGHYWGVDSNASLLDAGYSIELAQAGLTERMPRSNLLHEEEFAFDRTGQCFDIAIAQSVFTHLSANRIRLCLSRLPSVMRPGGRLFATYFDVPETHASGDPFPHPKGITTFSHKDPFHYSMVEMEFLLTGLPWKIVWTGEWDHPRDQQMIILERLP